MLHIDRDHPTFLLQAKVQEICNPFLKQQGLKYFQYLRCYSDGSFSLLTTETGFFDLMSALPRAPVIYSSFTEEHESKHSYWFLWDEELPAVPVQLVRERLKLFHGVTLVRRAKDYYDMIAFALPDAHRNIGSFYLNKYQVMEQFIQMFEKESQDLIRGITEQPIIVPAPYRDSNYHKICLKNGRIEITSPNGLVHITAQELTCLRLLLQGQTYKQIAAIMRVSPRTVETYIKRIKERSGMLTRHDLESLVTVCQ